MRSAPRFLVGGRGTVIITVVVVAVLTLAMPLREFIGQRTTISAVEEQSASRQARVDALRAELDRWENPEYVRAQARSRLHYVLPGEVGYIVLEADARDGESLANQVPPSEVQRPWFSRLWRSVQGADS